jgi:hypothetical protein
MPFHQRWNIFAGGIPWRVAESIPRRVRLIRDRQGRAMPSAAFPLPPPTAETIPSQTVTR